MRWIADGGLPDAAIAKTEPLCGLGSVMHYLMADPVEQTVDDFVRLGARLRDVGRFPVSRPSLWLAALRVRSYLASPAALVSAEVVPFRPHRGVLLLIEEPTGDPPETWLRWLHAEHYSTLLSQPGVAGVWTFGDPYAPPVVPASWISTSHYVTVVYLDEDPCRTVEGLSSIVRDRWRTGEVEPKFAGPFRSMITWDAWP